MTLLPVHQVIRSPARLTVPCVVTPADDGGSGTGVLDSSVPASSTTDTRGVGVGRYTAVVVSDTASTRAPDDGDTRCCGTSRRSGSSSSLPGRSSVSRTSASPGHDCSTDTAAELAAADSIAQPLPTPTWLGFTRASTSPYPSTRTMSERHISRRVLPAASTVVPSEDSSTWSSAYPLRVDPRRPVPMSIAVTCPQPRTSG